MAFVYLLDDSLNLGRKDAYGKLASINPMIIMDKAIDMSTRLSGSQFPYCYLKLSFGIELKIIH